MWKQSRFNTVVTAATVSVIINTVLNTTTTTTIHNNVTLSGSAAASAVHLTPPSGAILSDSTQVWYQTETDLKASTTTVITV